MANMETKIARRSIEDSGFIVLPGLPNEIALNCLGRVPLHLHSNLRSVCKAWHSLLSSPIFYSEPCKGLGKEWLYVQIYSSGHGRRWFAWNVQHRICLALPPFPADLTYAEFAVARGKLFSIGGSLYSNEVWAYDPCFHRWDSLRSMNSFRFRPAVGSIGGKIYVVGGCKEPLSDWAEVYDPAFGTWTSLVVHSHIPRGLLFYDCAVLDGKLFVLFDDSLGVIFDPATSSLTMDTYEINPNCDTNSFFTTWNALNREMALVKGILFACFKGKIRGYDFQKKKWFVLQGVGMDLQRGLVDSSFANVGEKLCMIWRNGTELTFACLDICKNQELLHCNVLWRHSVVSPCAGWIILTILSIGQ